jgi:hypothetical protein
MALSSLWEDRSLMGFDPYRKQVRRPSDYVIMASALFVVATLLVWALWGS